MEIISETSHIQKDSVSCPSYAEAYKDSVWDSEQTADRGFLTGARTRTHNETEVTFSQYNGVTAIYHNI